MRASSRALQFLDRLFSWKNGACVALWAGALLLAGCGGGGDAGGAVAPATAPTLDIRSNASGEAKTTFTVTFFFSDAVTLPATGLGYTLTEASTMPGTFTKVDSRTYTVQIKPTDGRQGLIDLRVPVGAYQDASGMASNKVAYDFSQPYNTLPPFAKLGFSGPVDSLGFLTGSAVFTMSFDAVLDAPLTVAKLQVSTGALSNFTRTSAAGQKDVYTFTYAPPAATRGVLTIELPRGSVSSGGIVNATDWWTFGLATP